MNNPILPTQATSVGGVIVTQQEASSPTRKRKLDSLTLVENIPDAGSKVSRSGSDSSMRAPSLDIIERILADLHAVLFINSMATVNAITDTYLKSSTLKEVAIELTKSGFNKYGRDTFDLAITTANTITDPFDKSRTLTEVAVGQAKAGFLDAAKSTFAHARAAAANRDIPVPRRLEAIYRIAADEGKAGVLDTAAKHSLSSIVYMVRRIRDAGSRANAFIRMADQLAEVAGLNHMRTRVSQFNSKFAA